MRVRGERSDARRSRDALLRASAELMAERGKDVPMYEVARRAGVGQATLYRHFPDRSMLAAAVFEEVVDELERIAEAEPDDPGTFDRLLAAVVDNQVRMHGLVGVLREGAPEQPHVAHLTGRTQRMFAAPMRAAQSAGRLRGDLVPADLLMLIGMVEGVLDEVRGPEPRAAAAHRALELIRTGIAARP
jgi:AcrR family transcriptional regulator